MWASSTMFIQGWNCPVEEFPLNTGGLSFGGCTLKSNHYIKAAKIMSLLQWFLGQEVASVYQVPSRKQNMDTNAIWGEFNLRAKWQCRTWAPKISRSPHQVEVSGVGHRCHSPETSPSEMAIACCSQQGGDLAMDSSGNKLHLSLHLLAHLQLAFLISRNPIRSERPNEPVNSSPKPCKSFSTYNEWRKIEWIWHHHFHLNPTTKTHLDKGSN